jgi:hypothetical protein
VNTKDEQELKQEFYSGLKQMGEYCKLSDTDEFGAIVEEGQDVFFANIKDLYQPVKTGASA